jgi:hypothetical protein
MRTARDHCAARANRVFSADENTVINKSKNDLTLLLYKIADCVRTAFRPCTIGDSRGRLSSAQS